MGLIDKQVAIDAVLGMNGLDCSTDVYLVEDVINAIPEVDRWIPVTEKLPENDVDVLVTDWACNAPWIYVDKCGTYDDGTRFWYYAQNPIAWMPLPEPWKGEQG